jgi:DNA polymerase-1
MEWPLGDTSDNIPGIPGVGEKTAVKLLNENGTLENELSTGGDQGEIREKVREYEEQARFSKDLATFRPRPIEFNLTPLTFPICRGLLFCGNTR